jgi:uncharacterized protein YdcH (DUF465 family)
MGAVDTGDRAGQPAGEDPCRQLAAEHQALDHRLHELTERPYLSTTEQLEETRLKKRKLALKDQMARLSRRRHH